MFPPQRVRSDGLMDVHPDPWDPLFPPEPVHDTGTAGPRPRTARPTARAEALANYAKEKQNILRKIED